MGALKDIQDMCDRRAQTSRLIALGRLDEDVVLRNPPTFDWTPDEADRAAIMLEIADCALGTADNCGSGGEEAAEAREFYFSVRDKSLVEVKNEIQGYFLDSYEAANGDIDKYYDKSPELRRLIRLTLGIREEE